MAITVDHLARQLYVDPGDVRYLAEWISDDPIAGDVIPNGIGGEIRMVLEPHSERTLPMLWLQADMDTWREERGLSKPGDLNHAPGQPLGSFDPPEGM